MLLEHASAHRVEVDSEQTSVSMLCVRLYCTHPSRVRNVFQRRFVDLIIFIQHVFNPNGFQKICPDNDHNTYRKQFKCKSTCFHPMTCFCILISSCLYVSVGFCGSLLFILVNVFTVPRLQKYDSALTVSVAFEIYFSMFEERGRSLWCARITMYPLPEIRTFTLEQIA